MPLLEGKKALIFGIANHRFHWLGYRAVSCRRGGATCLLLPGAHGKIRARPRGENSRYYRHGM